MLRIGCWLLLGLTLCACDLHAGHYRKNPPRKCQTVKAEDFTRPPITFIRYDYRDSTCECKNADVWLTLWVDGNGTSHDTKVIWCSINDTTCERIALEAVSTYEFHEHKFGDFSTERIRHIIQFRPEYAKSDTARTGVSDSLHKAADFVPLEVEPEMIFQKQPEYPKLAKRDNIQGTVWVRSLVSADGTVRESAINKSSGDPSLDNAALLASYHNRYKPARQKGRDVAIWVTYRIDFRLY